MELKETLNALYKNMVLFIGFLVMGIIVGAVVYLLPARYYAVGSLYVSRNNQDNTSFFTYEGYYSQQVAVTYTNTAMALMESVDIRTKALRTLGIDINELNLRKYGQIISVKKAGPQIITLTVKNEDPEKAQRIWNEVAKQTISAVQVLNEAGDRSLGISKISESPTIKTGYKSIPVFLLSGLIGGFILGYVVVMLKEYMKGDK